MSIKEWLRKKVVNLTGFDNPANPLIIIPIEKKVDIINHKTPKNIINSDSKIEYNQSQTIDQNDKTN